VIIYNNIQTRRQFAKAFAEKYTRLFKKANQETKALQTGGMQ